MTQKTYTSVLAAICVLALTGCSAASINEDGSVPDEIEEAQEIEVLLDTEDGIIGTLCGSVKDLVSVWQQSEELSIGGALIQKTAITGFVRATEGLINAATDADPNLVGLTLAELNTDFRNKSGEISATDLAYFSTRANRVVVEAQTEERFSPEEVSVAELEDLRGLCRSFPNALTLDELSENSN